MTDQQWKVGSIVVTKLVEFEAKMPVAGFIKDALVGATAEDVAEIDWLKPVWLDDEDQMGGGVHSFLIEDGDERIIVDTGIGNCKVRTAAHFNKLNTDFLDRLEAFGWHPRTVTKVICTHLHVDHVGWNTVLLGDEWVPTFANAEYVFVSSEFDHWRTYASTPGADQSYDTQWARDMVDGVSVFEDSVKPVWEAGLVRLVAADDTIHEGIRLVPSPGHTPGHASVMIESGGESAVISGDMMHCVLQVARPDWSSVLDTDRALAHQTRERLLGEWADHSILLLGTHFGSPTGGYLVKHESSFRLE